MSQEDLPVTERIPPGHPPVMTETVNLRDLLPPERQEHRRLLGWDTAPLLFANGSALGFGVNLALHWHSLGVPSSGIAIEMGVFLAANAMGYWAVRRIRR